VKVITYCPCRKHFDMMSPFVNKKVLIFVG
jgi:hypothetical protein